jgi:hypothetical protein
MRNALPSPRAASGYGDERKTYSYPISNFKFDDNFNLNIV